MDWHRRDVSSFDTDLDRFSFERGRNTVIRHCRQGSELLNSEVRELLDDELSGWLRQCDSDSSDSTLDSDIRIVVSPRAVEASKYAQGPGAEGLTYMPFTRDTFVELMRRFHLSQSFVRTVLRGELHLSYQTFGCGSSLDTLQCFNMRMDNSWSRDLALSTCSNVNSGVTCAIVLGCDQGDVRVLIRWLQTIRNASHPILLPSLFAELQLRRHKALIGRNWSKLVSLYAETGLYHSHNTKEPCSVTSDYSDTTRHILEMHQDTGFLENSLVKCQRKLKQLRGQAAIDESTIPSDQRDSMEMETARISMRLEDMVDDYEEIRAKCKLITDGASILTGAVWNLIAQRENAINQSIAAAARRDSYAMKSLALMSVIFLPGTFVAALFDTTFFDWRAPQGKSILSERFWIYWVVVIPLTMSVLLIWTLWYIRSTSLNTHMSSSRPQGILSNASNNSILHSLTNMASNTRRKSNTKDDVLPFAP